jgi:HK97 family phage portal protein
MAFKYLRNQVTEQPTTTGDISIADINALFGGKFGTGENLSEVTYFTCLKLLSETIGKLNIDLLQDTDKGTIRVKDHETYQLLKHRPNPYMTPSSFKSLIEFNRNHHGNAYIWTRWRGSKLNDMWVLDSEHVKILVDNEGILGTKNRLTYEYTEAKTGKKYIFSSSEIIHLKGAMSRDGIVGLAVQDVLQSTMDGNKANQAFLNNLNKKGFTARAVLEYVGDLDKSRKNELVKTLEEYALGEENAGRIVPVPLGMKLTPLDLKLTDSQYFELKKYSALQIAAAFGIKPSHINNYDKSSYASSEAQNLSFYVDTLLFILKQYEEELNYKLLTAAERAVGLHFKFNVSSILRADLKTQAEVLAIYTNNGIKTANECREVLDVANHEHGDRLLMNGNYIPIEQAGKQYDKGGGE